jgi:hypothetical protein
MGERIYVTEHRSRTCHIEDEREHTTLYVDGGVVTIIKRIEPAGYGMTPERHVMSLRLADLIEALAKLERA